MIYQYRLVIARGGRLEGRQEEFQRVAINTLEDFGPHLVGTSDIYVGNAPGAAISYMRERENLAT